MARLFQMELTFTTPKGLEMVAPKVNFKIYI